MLTVKCSVLYDRCVCAKCVADEKASASVWCGLSSCSRLSYHGDLALSQ